MIFTWARVYSAEQHAKYTLQAILPIETLGNRGMRCLEQMAHLPGLYPLAWSFSSRINLQSEDKHRAPREPILRSTSHRVILKLEDDAESHTMLVLAAACFNCTEAMGPLILTSSYKYPRALHRSNLLPSPTLTILFYPISVLKPRTTNPVQHEIPCYPHYRPSFSSHWHGCPYLPPQPRLQRQLGWL